MLSVSCRSIVRLKLSATGSLAPASNTAQQPVKTGKFPLVGVNGTLGDGPPNGKGLVKVQPGPVQRKPLEMSWNGLAKLGLICRAGCPGLWTPNKVEIANGGMAVAWLPCTAPDRS